jgi:heme exporter protein B
MKDTWIAEAEDDMQTLRGVCAIVRKDLALEKRSQESLSAMFIFGLIVMLVFSFSFELRAEAAVQVAPGVLWVAFTFAGMLGLSRSFIRESDQGCLDGLLLCPVERHVIYFGKLASNLIFIFISQAIILPLYVALFNCPFSWVLLFVIVLGTVAFASVGTLFSALTVHTRAREVMLPVLLFPVVMPALVAAVKLTSGILGGLPLAEIMHWLHLLIGCDVIFLAASYMCFEYVVEE